MHNQLTRELNLYQSICDIWDYDSSIFDNMTLPAGIDKDLTLDAIFQKYGQTPLFRPDPNWLKYYIGSWCRKNAYTWGKLYATCTVEYNPIDNYDRTEEYSDTHTSELTRGENENTNRTGSITDSGESSSSENRQDSESNSQNERHEKGTSAEHTVSADNSDWYQAGNKDSYSGSDNDTIDINNESEGSTHTSNTTSATQESNDNTGRELTGTENITESTTHSIRAHGNIGVTTTQQMLQSERELVQFNIYDYIADSFHNEFCLLIY